MNKLISLGLFFGIMLSVTAQNSTIYTIGDSTMSDKENPKENPEHGWAQVLPNYFVNAIKIENHAVNGRSTKSFIDEGRWDAVVQLLKPGDYVFIQFGHNDQKIQDSSRYTNPLTAYRYNLVKFVKETKAKEAIPVLFTSLVRRNFNEHGVLVDTHGIYPMVARQVAENMNVPLIDLQYLTEKLEIEHGVEGSKKLHLHFAPGENPYYPEGKIDNTHLSEYGANKVAQLVINEIKFLKLQLVKYLDEH